MNGLNNPAGIINRQLPKPSFYKSIAAERISKTSFIRLPKRQWIYGILFLFLIWAPGLSAATRENEPVQIVVSGVEGEARKNVLAALEIPPGLIRDGKADRQWLERFVRQAADRIPVSLEPFGFYSARVTIGIETPKTDIYLIRVHVETGKPTIVNDVQVSVTGPGASEASLQALAQAFPLKKGDILWHPSYEQGKHDLQSRALDLGYLDAEYSVHEIRIDDDPATAQVILVLDTKERYFFSDVIIEGAPDYPDAFLRRFVPFRPGDVFSPAKLAETQYQFNNSERFREVTVQAEKQNATDFKVPVRVLLNPSPRQNLRPGVGYGTDTGARVALRYRNLNLFHRGHELSSNLYFSERLQGLSTAYILPDTRDIRSYTSAQVNFQKEDSATYLSSFVALELARTTNFSRTRQGSVYVRFQHENYRISSQDSVSRYVLPGVRFADNYYDSIIRPTRGFRYSLDVRGTASALGSTTQLLQVMADASHVLSLPWRLKLLTGARTGITLLSDPLSDLPPSLRFFAGGDQSVRGYGYQSLGPKDATGQVIGGKHLLTFHADLQRAILDDWGVSVFYNAGNAFDSFTAMTLSQAVGAGVHYYTPVGALNLFLARQIQTENPEYRVHFTIGFEF